MQPSNCLSGPLWHSFIQRVLKEREKLYHIYFLLLRLPLATLESFYNLTLTSVFILLHLSRWSLFSNQAELPSPGASHSWNKLLLPSSESWFVFLPHTTAFSVFHWRNIEDSRITLHKPYHSKALQINWLAVMPLLPKSCWSPFKLGGTGSRHLLLVHHPELPWDTGLLQSTLHSTLNLDKTFIKVFSTAA